MEHSEFKSGKITNDDSMQQYLEYQYCTTGLSGHCLQEVAQSAGITPHEAEITNSNIPSPSYVDMSKKKKKKSLLGH